MYRTVVLSSIAARLVALCVVTVGCASNSVAARDPGATDAPTLDGALPDAEAADAAPVDARADASDEVTGDAGLVDGSLVHDGGPDAAHVASDAGLDAGSEMVILESATLGAGASTGSVIRDDRWPGWRFEVTGRGLEVVGVGWNGHVDDTNRLFVAVVALTGPDDLPDASDLSGSDVIRRSLFVTGPVGVNHEIDVPMDVTLAPGWFAIVVGAGAHFATSAGGLVVDGHEMVPGAQPTFALHPTTGALVPEATGKRFYVRGRPL